MGTAAPEGLYSNVESMNPAPQPSGGQTVLPDPQSLIECVGGPCALVLADDPKFTAVAVNNSFLSFWRLAREETLGKGLLEAMAKTARQANLENFRSSFRQVIVTGERHSLPLQQPRCSDPYAGCSAEDWWRPVNSPVAGEGGAVQFILHQLENASALARAETALAHAKSRHELLIRLTVSQRKSADPEAMMTVAAEAVGRFLQADRTGFFEMRGEDMQFGTGWSSGRLPLLNGALPGGIVGSGYLREVQAGKTLGIADARTNPLTADSLFGQIGTVSLIGVPVIRNGRWHAGFYVNHSEPREWTEEEILLVRDVGEQTWDAVERARAEAARRESEERFAFAMEAGRGIGAWDWDIPNDRFYCNRQFAELFSVDPDRAAAGVQLAEFVAGIHPDDRGRIAGRIADAVVNAGGVEAEYRVVQPDGTARWIYATGRCRLGDDGRPLRFPGVVFDISERKRAEEQLRQQWHTFDTALSNIEDFTYTFDLDGRFTYVNRSLLSLWQKPLEEARGKNFFELGYPPELAARLQRQIQEVIATRETLRDHTPFTGPTGETRHYEYIFVPVLAAGGGVEAVAGSTRDVTERRQAEENERELQAQLRDSARLESLGIMAGGIAHDFNNLLVGILGNASLLVEEAAEPDRAIAADIVLAAERAADLTSQMLAYSGKGHFFLEICDLNGLIRENLTLLRSSISRKVRVEMESCPEACFIEADRAQIQQLAMNLCINASEAAGDAPGEVAIRTAMADRPEASFSSRIQAAVPSGRYAVLEIRDKGMGMSAETLKRIFDPFFTTKFTGRGLGLAAVLGIVRGHHGDIEVESVPGRGSTFRIFLPSVASTGAPCVKPREQFAGGAGQLVLVVDDEHIVRRTATLALEKKGFRVTAAADGSEALASLRANPDISLVLLDLTMPVMTGEEAIPLLKAARPGIPIILSSGFSQEELSRRFGSAGLAGFLQKPYSVEALASKVSRVLQRETGRSGTGS